MINGGYLDTYNTYLLPISEWSFLGLIRVKIELRIKSIIFPFCSVRGIILDAGTKYFTISHSGTDIIMWKMWIDGPNVKLFSKRSI